MPSENSVYRDILKLIKNGNPDSLEFYNLLSNKVETLISLDNGESGGVKNSVDFVKIKSRFIEVCECKDYIADENEGFRNQLGSLSEIEQAQKDILLELGNHITLR
jgi:hypothetical protein